MRPKTPSRETEPAGTALAASVADVSASDLPSEGAGGPPAKPGRRPIYTPELGQAFCAEIAASRSLRDTCGKDGMPSERTVFRWLAEHEDFARLYQVARATACDGIVASILELADAEPAYIEESGKHGGTVRRVDPGHVAHVRNQIDAKKWLLSKLKPQVYGDSVSLTGAAGAPLVPPPQPFTITEVAEIAIRLLRTATVEEAAAPEVVEGGALVAGFLAQSDDGEDSE